MYFLFLFGSGWIVDCVVFYCVVLFVEDVSGCIGMVFGFVGDEGWCQYLLCFDDFDVVLELVCVWRGVVVQFVVVVDYWDMYCQVFQWVVVGVGYQVVDVVWFVVVWLFVIGIFVYFEKYLVIV